MKTYHRLHQTQKIPVGQFKDLCRLCMNADISMYDIFTVSEENQAFSLAAKILKCLSIEVKDSDGFPTKLCACCLKSLNSFAEFWEQCHRTNKKLHQLLESSDPSSLFGAVLLPSPSYSGYDELYKSPEHSHLFSIDDEDQPISESPVHYAPFPSNSSENVLVGEGIGQETVRNNSTHDPSNLSGEIPSYIPSEISIFENDVSAAVNPAISSKFELEEVSAISQESNNVEVQVSLNGNSYIVKVLEQSCGKDSKAAPEVDRDDIGDSSLSSEVIPVCLNKISYQCSHCKDSFENRSDLKTHVKMHREAKGLTCKFCSKWFSIKSGLVRHERIHSGEKPYKCDNCSRSFTQKEVLRRHLLTHSGDKPFKCDSCDKSYTQKGALRMHAKTNHVPKRFVEIMQYKCSLCEKSFCHLSGLSRHQQSHAGKKYPCKNCDRVFTDQSCLKRHYQRLHLSGTSETSGKKGSNNSAKQTRAAIKV